MPTVALQEGDKTFNITISAGSTNATLSDIVTLVVEALFLEQGDVVHSNIAEDGTLAITVRVSDDSWLDVDSMSGLIEQRVTDEYGDDAGITVDVVPNHNYGRESSQSADSDSWVYAVTIGGSLIVLLCGCLVAMMRRARKKGSVVETQSTTAMGIQMDVRPRVCDNDRNDAPNEIEDVQEGQQMDAQVTMREGVTGTGTIGGTNGHAQAGNENEESFEVQSEDEQVMTPGSDQRMLDCDDNGAGMTHFAKGAQPGLC